MVTIGNLMTATPICPSSSSSSSSSSSLLLLAPVKHRVAFLSTTSLSEGLPRKKSTLLSPARCEKKKWKFDPSKVEPPPYHVYLDSTSGELEPASGARASIPGEEYWPEGTASRVRAARAPEPLGKSEGMPSYGKKPGSRRKGSKVRVAASESSERTVEEIDQLILEEPEDNPEALKNPSEEYVIYQHEEKEENLSSYEEDKRIGRPHPFVDPSKNKPIKEPLSSEELWWNWRKVENEQWSRWHRRRADVDTVFAKAMAETGQIKLYGDHPTVTEAALARTRKEVFKQERLEAAGARLEEIGPIAYYSEWVKGWKKDTSREAVQRHYEETGEDENTQLIRMFQHQTAEEFRIMMGTDVRIQRDPLAMRMREDQIKEIWGGDPVYPTINYVQDPNEVIDYRGPNFHEPMPNVVAYLMEHGRMISREDLKKRLAEENPEEIEVTDLEEDMENALDIGEGDDEEDSDSEVEEVNDKVEEKIGHNESTHLQKSKISVPLILKRKSPVEMTAIPMKRLKAKWP